MAPPAGRARLYYDHQSVDSEANQVWLEDGLLSIELLQTTGPDEALRVEPGLEALVGRTEDLVAQFNELIEFLNDHRHEIERTIFNQVMTEIDKSVRRLKDVGLALKGDGRLGVTERYAQIMEGEPEYVRDVLTGPEGFFTGLKEVLDQILGRNLYGYAEQIKAVPRTYKGTAKIFQALQTGLYLSVSA